MFSSYGCSGNLKYERYSSKDIEINISMDYISGWLYSEHRGSNDSYAQVIFYELAKKDKTSRVGMAVTVEKSSKVRFQPLTLEAMADDLLNKRLKFKDARILSKVNTSLFDTEALDIELSYKTLDKLYSADAKLIPVKERIIIFKRNDRFYTLRYENTEEEFNKFAQAFTHCIGTLKFKDTE